VVRALTGNCGFNPSHYTVECDLGQVVHSVTHCLCHQAV